MAVELKQNPWMSIWGSPAKTVGAIVKFNSRYQLWLLSILHGLPMLLHLAQNMSVGAQFKTGWILFTLIILSGIVGIIGITIGSAFCYWTGRWIGGRGSFTNVRAAVAWSNVPNVVTIAMWVLLFIVFREDLFNGAFATTTVLSKQILLLCAGVVQLVMAIWAIVILVKGLAQVHGFSSWKGLLNVVLAVLFFIAIFWALVLIAMWASKGMTA